jgi:large subunit ribosomal protein L24
MKTRFKKKVHIRKGDMVAVIAGSYRNRTKPRKVLEVISSEASERVKVLLEGVNMVTKHTKPSAKNSKGGIINVEAPIDISNVMLWDPKKQEPSRITRKRENGRTSRVSKKTGEEIK